MTDDQLDLGAPSKRRWWQRKERTNKNEVEDIVRAFKAFAVGSGIALLVFGLLGYAVFRIEQDQDKQDKIEEQQADDRVERERLARSVENCKETNIGTTRERELFVQQIPELAVNFFQSTPEEVAALQITEGYHEYLDFIKEALPYRPCSVECVVAHSDPDIPNCPPARNEEGDV